MQTLKETLTFFVAAKITLNIDYHTVYTQQALILLTLFKTNKTKKMPIQNYLQLKPSIIQSMLLLINLDVVINYCCVTLQCIFLSVQININRYFKLGYFDR